MVVDAWILNWWNFPFASLCNTWNLFKTNASDSATPAPAQILQNLINLWLLKALPVPWPADIMDPAHLRTSAGGRGGERELHTSSSVLFPSAILVFSRLPSMFSHSEPNHNHKYWSVAICVLFSFINVLLNDIKAIIKAISYSNLKEIISR